MSALGGLVSFSGEDADDGAMELRLLLIDNDLHEGRRLQEALTQDPNSILRVEFVGALDAANSLLADQGDYDAVLLSLRAQDGHAANVALATVQIANETPVIMLADSEYEDLAAQATRFGVHDVIPRSKLGPDLLCWAVRHAVEQCLLRSSLERHVRELEISNQRFLSLVFDNGDAIVVVDRVGIVRFVNPSAERLLRCSASDLLGQMFGIPLEGVDKTEIDLRGNRSKRTAEIRVMRTLWEGERAFIVTMRDITDRKKSEVALRLAKQMAEQASEMKSQFLANMSHELRTPLNAIVGYSELMMLGVGGETMPERYQEYVKDIHTGGKHLLSLINDLLDLSKAESGKLEVASDNVDLVDLTAAVAELMSGQAMAKGVILSTSAERAGLWLRIDERMIKQVLFNVVSNAIKFTPKGGRVSMAVGRTQNGDSKIVIKDTGIGIPSELIPRAFAAFVQIDNAYSRTQNAGTGLGLALAKKFIELHQGSIRLESEEGAGTTVTVTLPNSRSIGSDAPGHEILSIDAAAVQRSRNREASRR